MATASFFFTFLLAATMVSFCLTDSPLYICSIDMIECITIDPCNDGGGTQSATFTIENNCPYTIWPAAQDAAGSPPLETTGFELAAGASQPVNAPKGWTGRFWARTQCTSSGTQFTCETGDCGSGLVSCNGNASAPPTTLIEFTLNGNGGRDFYDLSLVDGFNLPVFVVPQNKGCDTRSCATDINGSCPTELAKRDSSNTTVIGCKSACVAFNKPEYCCTGDHNTQATCPETSYSEKFKNWCPEAYSNPFDESYSAETCPSGGDYVIKFCPAS